MIEALGNVFWNMANFSLSIIRLIASPPGYESVRYTEPRMFVASPLDDLHTCDCVFAGVGRGFQRLNFGSQTDKVLKKKAIRKSHTFGRVHRH
jgi:hypothetical protein